MKKNTFTFLTLLKRTLTSHVSFKIQTKVGMGDLEQLPLKNSAKVDETPQP